MGLQQRMIDTMMARQSAEDAREMMREMMPRMTERLDAEGMVRMLEDVMPDMMASGFSRMDRAQRESMLAHWRGMLDRVEEKYRNATPS